MGRQRREQAVVRLAVQARVGLTGRAIPSRIHLVQGGSARPKVVSPERVGQRQAKLPPSAAPISGGALRLRRSAD